MDTTIKTPNWLMRYLDKQLTTSQFTAKQIVDLYIPMVLDYFSIFAINILASAMVSASSQEAISAVSLVGSLGFMVTALFSAMSTGGTVLVAQAKGRGDENGLKKACGQTILLTSIMGIICTFILVAFADPIVHLLFGEANPLIVEYGITYLVLYAWSYIPFAIFNSINSCFRGMGEAKKCLVLSIIINVAHLVFSFIFINGMDMGVAGSGWSLIIARIIGAVCAVGMMFFVSAQARIGIKDLFNIKVDFLKKIFKLAMPFAVEQILFQAGVLLTNTYVSKLPDDSIAANSIALSVFNLLFIAANALMGLIMTVCGQCVGAKNYDLARHYVNSFIKFGRVVLLANVLITAPLMPLLMILYQPSATVEPVVYQLLGIGALANILLWCDGYLIPACLRSAGDAAFTTVASLASMWVARVMIGYLLTMVLGFGIYGVWLTYYIEYGIRLVIFRIRLKGNSWQKM